MRYQTFIPLKLKTSSGLLDLKPGDTFKPKNEEAIKELLAEGLVKLFCNWQDDVIEDCQPPCFHISEKTVIRECKHFKEYWQRRLREVNKI